MAGSPLLAARTLLLCAGALTLWPADLRTAPDPRRVRVAASERYERGRIHRFAFGGGYRELWKAEIELPVLDLGQAGGLTPTRRFGGLQTAVLGFRGGDGRLYTFRGTDKDPSAVLDPELHGTVVQTLVQDQMAAQHPGGPLVAGVISQAAGVLTIRERMVVMPDDPTLGGFRDEFAGMVGTFYEYPTPASEQHPGFHGASEIIDHKELFERLARGSAGPVDTEALLRARLVDVLIGDFDRHRKQWRWARLPGDPAWQPIPEDRDQAFVRYDGVVQRIASIYLPILQRYGPRYPAMKGLTFHGWEQDRWLLAGLSWPQWESIAVDLQRRIGDDVIEEAIAELPPEYAELDAERLRSDLRGRRDRLTEGARSFYEHLAREVDVQGSDAPEQVLVRHEEGRMRVEVRRQGAAEPTYRRTFEPWETRDVRVYLRGGDDSVRVEGSPGWIHLRVIADAGRKVVDDSAGGGTRIYDSSGAAELHPGRRTRLDARPYTPPPSQAGFVDVEGVPPRDWGSDFLPFPIFGFEDDVGAFIGLGGLYTRYGFRKHPWSSRHRFSAGWATEANRPRVHYVGSFRRENSKLRGELEVGYSGIEILRFYGFGNNTSDAGSDSFFRVRNQQVRVAPTLILPLADERLRVAAGPWFQHSRTENGARLIDLLAPYGSGSFGATGAFASFSFDSRQSHSEHSNLALPLHDNPAAGYPTRGVFFELTGQLSPPLWDVERTWGFVEGSVAGHVSAGEEEWATLALRVGGKRTLGRTPYFAAAYIGGGEFFGGSAAVRGYRAQRFAGDASVFGNLDLRLRLARVRLVVPGDVGVFGFADLGRVFVDGAAPAFPPASSSSRRWHPSGGGGVWFAPLTRTNAISLSVADSPEETLFYLRLGFHY